MREWSSVLGYGAGRKLGGVWSVLRTDAGGAAVRVVLVMAVAGLGGENVLSTVSLGGAGCKGGGREERNI